MNQLACLLVATFLAGISVATAADYRAAYPYKEEIEGKYKYYTVFFYYTYGHYPSNPSKYLSVYCTNYHRNAEKWYGDKAKNMVGYTYGYGEKENPGYSKYARSYGGYAVFNSYYDAYQWVLNPTYGFVSGYYDNDNYDNGEYSYGKNFGVYPGKNGPKEFGLDIKGEKDLRPLQEVF